MRRAPSKDGLQRTPSKPLFTTDVDTPTRTQRVSTAPSLAPNLAPTNLAPPTLGNPSYPAPTLLSTPPPVAVPPPAATACLFELSVQTQWGDTAVLVGSVPALGEWQPDRGVRLSTDKDCYPTWKAQLLVPGGVESVEYKIVILRADGQVDWEPLTRNRELRLRAGSAVRVRSAWNAPSADETWSASARLTTPVPPDAPAAASHAAALPFAAAKPPPPSAVGGAGLPHVPLTPPTYTAGTTSGMWPASACMGALEPPQASMAAPSPLAVPPTPLAAPMPAMCTTSAASEPLASPRRMHPPIAAAPKPNASFSLPQNKVLAACPTQHPAFDPQHARDLFARGTREGCAAAAQPSPSPMGMAPHHQATQQQHHHAPPVPNMPLALPSAPVPAAAASHVLPLAGHSARPVQPGEVPSGGGQHVAILRGAPLEVIRSQDMSWPPSLPNSLRGSDGSLTDRSQSEASWTASQEGAGSEGRSRKPSREPADIM